MKKLKDLETAALAGDIATVQEIIASGVDVNVACGEHDETPLILSSSIELTNWLLANGADIHARDNRGRTALFSRIHYKTGLAPDFKLLLDAGADINAVDNEGTPLLFNAVWTAKLDVVETLIAHGADVFYEREGAGDWGNENARTEAENLGFLNITRVLRMARNEELPEEDVIGEDDAE
jgi:ankyrin repeat protein